MEDWHAQEEDGRRPSKTEAGQRRAAAIDIGSTMHMAAVNPLAPTCLCALSAHSRKTHELADWFKTCGVTSVAMESTGVNWIPVYEILEQRGLVVNARYAQNVRGRKTGVSDAAWLRQLHSYACYAAASDLMPRSQPCARICANGSA